MNIREATIADVPGLVPVWREMMDFHAERDVFWKTREGAEDAFSKYVSENIKKDEALVLVAQNNEKIVAYCQCLIVEYPPVLITKQYGNIVDLAVCENYRRNGIGEKMVKWAMEWFKTKGLERAEVRVAVTNEISMQFWRKMGFTTYLETMSKQVVLPEQT